MLPPNGLNVHYFIFEQVHQSGSGWSPVVCANFHISHQSHFITRVQNIVLALSCTTNNLVIFYKFVEDNLAVMSVGFLLGSPDDAVIWRGPKKNGIQ